MSTKTFNQQQFQGEHHAKVYSMYRPNPSDEIVKKTLDYLREKYDGDLGLAVDVGCGSGQSSVILTKYFHRVIGLDVSEAQVKEAIKSRAADNIEYKVQEAESLPFADASVHLITASSCLHWFHLDSFFEEVKRTLAPSGVLAAYVYTMILPSTEDEAKNDRISLLMREVYHVHLKSYWAKEVKDAFDGYKSIHFPFKNVLRLNFRETFRGTLKDLFCFVTTLSAFQNYQTEMGKKAANELIKDLRFRMCDILDLKEDDSEWAAQTFYRDFNIILCRKGDDITKECDK